MTLPACSSCVLSEQPLMTQGRLESSGLQVWDFKYSTLSLPCWLRAPWRVVLLGAAGLPALPDLKDSGGGLGRGWKGTEADRVSQLRLFVWQPFLETES
jgi:hypothetical protein